MIPGTGKYYSLLKMLAQKWKAAGEGLFLLGHKSPINDSGLVDVKQEEKRELYFS